MDAIIYGCGRLARLLAPYLVQSGYTVTALDANPTQLESVVAEPQVKGVLIADPMMHDYLQEAHVDTVELFIALSDDEHQNALVSQLAKHIYHVPLVVCRFDNPQLQQLYSGLGLKVVGFSILDLFSDIQRAIGRD
jgi:Trk K+ transport system NAD-binding subunit